MLLWTRRIELFACVSSGVTTRAAEFCRRCTIDGPRDAVEKEEEEASESVDECKWKGEGSAPVGFTRTNKGRPTAIHSKITTYVTIMACTACSQSYFTVLCLL